MTLSEVRGLKILMFSAWASLMYGVWLPLPAVDTVSIMSTPIASMRMDKVFHFIVELEANLQYL